MFSQAMNISDAIFRSRRHWTEQIDKHRTEKTTVLLLLNLGIPKSAKTAISCLDRLRPVQLLTTMNFAGYFEFQSLEYQ